jgi:hypothetical protein
MKRLAAESFFAGDWHFCRVIPRAQPVGICNEYLP